jgi:transcriptional regulator of acetoin/glycerol metabolism
MKRSASERELMRRFVAVGQDGALRILIDPYLLERWARQEHPLNLRGLESELLRAVAESHGDRIEAPSHTNTSAPSTAPTEPSPGPAPRGAMRELSREELMDLMQRDGWNVSQAARSLGCSRFQLHRQIRKHGLKPPAH